MKIVIPMAGRGTRLRPHTLDNPKPLFVINGKTIVQRLIEGLADSFEQSIDEIAFVIGDFGDEVEDALVKTAENLGAKARIYYQNQALGTAHAVHCASESLKGDVVVAFADTLFYSDFKISQESDSIIWTKKVSNPESFGVVITDNKQQVTDFAEKPEHFVSDRAIIGIYYFKNGDQLQESLQKLIDNKKTVKGEYQITDALEDLKEKGTKFKAQDVNKWMDCGNSRAVLDTASAVTKHEGHFISPSSRISQSVIIEPCYIGPEALIENSVIGPFVSLENNAIIKNTVLSESLIGSGSRIVNSAVSNSVIGSNTQINKNPDRYDLGSYSKIG